MSCKGCAYAVFIGGMWCCDYLLLTGHRRPCPPGSGCTVRKEANLTKKGAAFMAKRKWDTEKAMELYKQGLPDAKIAEAVGVPTPSVALWRRGLNLPPNKESPCPPEAASKPEAAVPKNAVPRNLPVLTGPLALSVELNGCAFSLRAPDTESAAQIYEYAGQMLKRLTCGKG